MKKHDLSFDKVVLDYDELIEASMFGLAMATNAVERAWNHVKDNGFKDDYNTVDTDTLRNTVIAYDRISNTVYALMAGKNRAIKEIKENFK